MKNFLSALVATLCVSGVFAQGDSSAAPAATAFIGIVGDTADVQPAHVRQGFLLAGGSTDVDPAMKWLLEMADGGDVVVLRASGSTGYNQYMFNLSQVNSVESLLINSAALANDPAVASRIRQAECLFIAGGDQWNYIHFWMGTPVGDAINYLVNIKKVPLGGTSAGLAVLGQFAFSAEKGSITSEEALANPYSEKLTLTKDFISNKLLANLVTDSHYRQRERQGRHIAFMARMLQQGNRTAKGIGVDEKTAVAIDASGSAKVFGSGNAYFYKAITKPEKCVAGQPLEWYTNGKALQVYIIAGSPAGNGSIHIPKWKKQGGGAEKYAFVKDGAVNFN